MDLKHGGRTTSVRAGQHGQLLPPPDPSATWQPQAPSVPNNYMQPRPPRRSRGAWYWVLAVLTIGMFVAIPMWRAYGRLKTPRQLKIALALLRDPGLVLPL